MHSRDQLSALDGRVYRSEQHAGALKLVRHSRHNSEFLHYIVQSYMRAGVLKQLNVPCKVRPSACYALDHQNPLVLCSLHAAELLSA